MADMVPDRIGQINGAGDAKALFLKVFAGEVLTAFNESNQFLARHRLRSITSGKSAQFPVLGKGSAAYHTPGAQLLGTSINKNEQVIAIDDVLIADRFIADIDEAMTHYDVRSELTRDVGRALAATFDQHVAQVGVLAARASATVTGGDGGTEIIDADSDTNGASMVTSLFTAAQNLDEKDIPKEDRFVFVSPAQYYILVQEDKVLNKDFSGAPGDFSEGNLAKVAGMSIVPTNNLPSTNITTGPATYQGDFSTTTALVMHKSAVGTVKLMDVAVENEYLIEYQGDLLLAKMAIGHGILRPESAVEIKTA